MINRGDIRHAAILKPQLTKCAIAAKTGRHDFANGKACADCGIIKSNKEVKTCQTTPPSRSLKRSYRER